MTEVGKIWMKWLKQDDLSGQLVSAKVSWGQEEQVWCQQIQIPKLSQDIGLAIYISNDTYNQFIELDIN